MIGESTQVCSFRIGPSLFGIEVDAIREVIRGQLVTPVPLAPPAILGLMNLRGQIVTVVDLRARMALGGLNPDPLGGVVDDGSPDRSSAGVHLILRGGGHPVSLAVDEVEDVFRVSYDLVEPPPVTMGTDTQGMITGAYKLPDQVLLLLDEERLVDLSVLQAG